MEDREKLEVFYGGCLIRLTNIEIEINNSHKRNHPQFPVALIKPDFPDNIPSNIREDELDKIHKKYENMYENTGITPLVIKKISKLDENNINNHIKKKIREKNDNSSIMEEKARLKSIIHHKEEILDSYYNVFKRGFIETFTLFERFNNEIFKNYFKNFNPGPRSITNIDKVERIIKRNLKIDLTKQFSDWMQLKEYFYLRNIMVHRDGRIDDEFIKLIKNSTGKILDRKKNLGKKIHIKSKEFNDLTTIIKKYLQIINNKLVNYIS